MAMKTRGWIMIAVIVLLFIAVIAYAGSQTPASKTKLSQVITVTVLNNIGIKQIDIQNLNTGKTFVFSLISLPAQFNCTRGDYLEINVLTNNGYRWNAWWFSPQDVWNNDNPAIICVAGNIVINNEVTMIPNCLILPQGTVTPSPNPTEKPIE